MAMRLHHVGMVVPAIEPAAEELQTVLGYTALSGVLHDPVQTALAQFFRQPGERSCVELVAPDGQQSKLCGALKRGNGLNHVCYATDDLEGTIEHLRERGMVLIHEPVSAAAFPGRRIAWMMGGLRVLTELIDEGVDPWDTVTRAGSTTSRDSVSLPAREVRSEK